MGKNGEDSKADLIAGCAGCSLMSGDPYIRYHQKGASIQVLTTALIHCGATNSLVRPISQGSNQEQCRHRIRMEMKQKRDALRRQNQSL